MAQSADELLFRDRELTLTVFTDQPDFAQHVGSGLHRAKVRVVEVPPLAWPDATILRYQLIRDHSEELDSDLLLHMDADMVVANPVGPGLDPASWHGGLALVRHPGYYRPRGLRRALLYGGHPKLIVRDLGTWATTGALGAWEAREASQAYVSRAHRSRYYCGGVWLGARSAVLELASTLAARVSRDEAAGITAVWHDESHLNRYATEHPHTALGPEYCYAPGYPQLQGTQPLIIAVDKGSDWSRD